MTKMRDIIELLQQLKSRKLYEEYVREFDRINIHYFNCKDENNKIYFINLYNNLYNNIKCSVSSRCKQVARD